MSLQYWAWLKERSESADGCSADPGESNIESIPAGISGGPISNSMDSAHSAVEGTPQTNCND